MSTIWFTGFDTMPAAGINLSTIHLGAIDAIVGSPAIDDATPRFGDGYGPNHFQSSNRTAAIGKHFGSNLDAGIVGFAFNPGTSGTGIYRGNIMVLFDGSTINTAGNVQIGLVLNNDLSISIFRNTHATTLGSTAAGVLVPNQWHTIELKFKIADSIASGDVELRVDGTSVLTLAAATDTKHTSNAYVTTCCLNGSVPTITGAGTTTFRWDDWYAFTLTGSQNNNFLGRWRVCGGRPTGNGANSGMTGSDGNSTDNYLLVDDPVTGAWDGDTTYVGSAVDGTKDTYTFPDLPAGTSAVYSVSVNNWIKKTDAGARGYAPVVRIGSTDYPGTEVSLTDSYTLRSQYYDVKPSDSTTWSASDVNAAEFGFEAGS